jgi:hypothetical protein
VSREDQTTARISGCSPVTRSSGPSVVGSRLTSEGEKLSGFMVPDWLTLSFAGRPDFSRISVVYQGFSDKSDGFCLLRSHCGTAIRALHFPFAIPCVALSEQHFAAFKIFASSPSHRRRVGFKRPMPQGGVKSGRGPHPVAVQRRRSSTPSLPSQS